MAAFKFPKIVRRRLNEMTVSQPMIGLRNSLSALRQGFYVSPTSPALRDTKIDKDKARSLYYNTDLHLTYGAFVARNIVDGTADYIGIPSASVGDEQVTELVNNWILNYWKLSLWEAFRNCLREGDTWIRLRKPFPMPYSAPDESSIIHLEVIDSDRVTPYFNPATGELARVEILTRVYIEDEPFNPENIYAQGIHAHGREHQIIEIITPTQFTYFDATNNVLLDQFTTHNDWNFVPCVQFFNDFDSALNGGMSDLETVYPFFIALHELIIQTRTAHKYTANPKVKFKLDDVTNFLRNNFPQSFVNGQFTGKVSWRDTDVFFMESTEDAGFVEATMNTSDSVTLMEFILDCICIAAGVTEAVLLRARAEGPQSSDESDRFNKKIERKRNNFEGYISSIIQMALYIVSGNPVRPKLSWQNIQIADLVAEATAMNQIVTAAEVANRAGVISRYTYRGKIRQFFPDMKDTTQEEQDISADVKRENDNQLAIEKSLASIGASSNGNGGGSGANSATRARAALKTDVSPPPASG